MWIHKRKFKKSDYKAGIEAYEIDRKLKELQKEKCTIPFTMIADKYEQDKKDLARKIDIFLFEYGAHKFEVKERVYEDGGYKVMLSRNVKIKKK